MAKYVESKEIEKAMRASGDPLLYVFAELNSLVEEKLVELSNKCKKLSESGELNISPGHFMLAFTIFNLAQIETFHEAFKLSTDTKKEQDKLLAQVVGDVLKAGPRKLLLSMIMEAGIDIEAFAKETRQ